MSGLSRTPGKRVWANPHRGFESRPLRQQASKQAPFGALFCFVCHLVYLFVADSIGHLGTSLELAAAMFQTFPHGAWPRSVGLSPPHRTANTTDCLNF